MITAALIVAGALGWFLFAIEWNVHHGRKSIDGQTPTRPAEPE